MRRRALPESHFSHPNLTPLIDVVMCLIIFFMIVAKIGISTGAEEMVIPATIQGRDIKDLGNTLLLNVRAGTNDQPMITALVGGVREELKIRTASGEPQLASTLKFFRYGPTRRPNIQSDNPNFSIVIRAEEDLAYRYLEPVLMAAVEANVKNVSFNTRQVVGN